MTVLAAGAALPDGGGYVAAALIVFMVLLLVYFAIMASRLKRLEREAERLSEMVEEPGPTGAPAADG